MAVGLVLPIFTVIKEPFKKYVAGPIIRHISYAFRCDNKIETLQNQVEILNNKRLRLQQSVDDATRNGEEIFPDVTKWLTTAGKDVEDAEKLIQGKAQAMSKRFVGLCPNLKTRYQLSKKAHNKALAVGKQLQDAQTIPAPISFRPPLQQIIEPSVYSSEALPSRVLILNRIMDALKDPNLRMIGVYGMGGVGKTTLAKEVKGKAIQEKLFGKVVMVAVSQTPDLRRIQGEIADSLGLKLHAAGVPGRAARLHERLEKAKILIILDDVWQKLDLDDVGVPCGDAYKGCKILLTSRKKDVLCNEMGTQKEFSLEVLREEETWRLFEMSLRNTIDPELHGIATEIARKCAGLPLLILKVAADLRRKESCAWSDMLNRLSNVENTEIYEIVRRVIESSYEKLLDEEAKSLFLLCALFGGSNIEIHRLVMYSVGLSLFNGIYSIEGARNRVLSLIDKLKDACLLLDGDMAELVKMHDVVLDIARVIASRVQRVFVGAGRVRSVDFQNKEFARFSLPYSDVSELSEVLDFPEMEVFSLFAEDDSLDVPSSFFEGTPKLKVLDFTGVRFVSGLPSSIGFLGGLQTLCLQNCNFYNVRSIAALEQLEVLNFAGSSIRELPGEIKRLTRLKLLDLSRCRCLRVIRENVLSNLCLLEELYILDSFVNWGWPGKASLAELKNLPCLKTLELHIEHGCSFLPKNWFFDGVQNYKISIGPLKWYMGDYGTQKRILRLQVGTYIDTMHGLKEFVKGTEVLELVDGGVENLLCDCCQLGQDSFGRLQILEICKCDAVFVANLSHPFAKCLPQLQKLRVRTCDGMEAIVGGGNEQEEIEFTHLNFLELYKLPNLISFCKTTWMVSFPSLTTVYIQECTSMKYAFTTSMAKSLKQLQVLEIGSCNSMEGLILSKEAERIEEEVDIHRIVFPELNCLALRLCPNLKSFSSVYPVDFPSLTELTIFKCWKIENFNDLLTNNQRQISFPNLTRLKVSDCTSLKYVFTTSMAKSLKKLQYLKIRGCELMEEIISSNQAQQIEEEEENIKRIQFPKLEYLELYNLQNLKRFSSGNPIHFPSLRVLKIYDCREIENLVSKFPDEIDDKCIFNELVTVSNLEELLVNQTDRLTNIWNEDIDVDAAFNLRNLRSVYVSKCPDLKCVFPTTIACGLPQLELLEISQCGVEEIVGTAKDETFEWPNLTHFKIYDCPNLICISSNKSKVSFSNLEYLYIEGAYKLRDVWNEDINVDSGFNLNKLRSVHVSKCPDLKYVFPACGLPQLQNLKIEECGVEVIIRKVKYGSFEWPDLGELVVDGCKGLKYVYSVAKSLEKLEKLKIRRCELMEEILLSEEIEEENINTIVFPKLVELELENLPDLKRFSRGHPIDFPSLRRLVIHGCRAIESLVPKFVNGSNINERVDECLFNEMVSFSSLEDLSIDGIDKLRYIWSEDIRIATAFNLCTLRSVCVSKCPDLRYVFLASVARGLFQLRVLEIEECGVEVIVGKAEDDVFEWPILDELKVLNCHNLVCIDSKVNFFNMKKLDIGRMDKLKYIWSEDTNFEAPKSKNLNSVHISYCSNLRYVFIPSGIDSFVTLDNLVDLKLEWCCNCVQLPCLGKLPKLENLEMNHMGNVKCIDNHFYGIDNKRDGNLFPALKSLAVAWMENLVEWSDPSDGEKVLVFPGLQTLSIQNCPQLTGFPMRDLSQLVRLEIKNTPKLMLVIDEKQSFPHFVGLSTIGCSKLTNLRNWLQSTGAFKELNVRNCEWLTFVPHDLQKVRKLTSLEIYCCRRLRYFPEDILSKLTNLQRLSIGAFSEELDDFMYLNRIEDLYRLKALEIWGSDFYGREMCSLPNQLQNLRDLKSLRIVGFTAMESLPEWFANLQNLGDLSLDYCRNLKCESTETIIQELSNLSELSICSCPILQESESEWLQPLRSRDVEVELSHVSQVRARLEY